MFGVDSSEFLLIVLVAVVVIGPKDLPRVMRTVGHWVGKARGMANQFRSGVDQMVRESEIADLEKKWREQNDAIMKAHPMALMAGAAADEKKSEVRLGKDGDSDWGLPEPGSVAPGAAAMKPNGRPAPTPPYTGAPVRPTPTRTETIAESAPRLDLAKAPEPAPAPAPARRPVSRRAPRTAPGPAR